MQRPGKNRFLFMIVGMALGCGDCADSIHDDDELIILDSDFGPADLDDMDVDKSGQDGDIGSDAGTDDGNEDLGSDAESDSGEFDAGEGDAGNQDMEIPDLPDSDPVSVCGNGVLEAGEDCDFGPGSTCLGTHDGGLGTCVTQGTCSAGYEINGGQCVPQNTTGISTPCQNGPGQSLLRFSFSNNSTSPYIEVWNASCSYSLANQACNVVVVYPGFGSVSRTSEGYPILTSTHYIRARFSVSGLNFTRATLYVRGRSYSTGSSTQIRAWSPLYGDAFGGPVDNDFIYDWYPIDWSSYLYPGDNPNLTAFQLYAYQGSNSLAVRAVELCLE